MCVERQPLTCCKNILSKDLKTQITEHQCELKICIENIWRITDCNLEHSTNLLYFQGNELKYVPESSLLDGEFPALKIPWKPTINTTGKLILVLSQQTSVYKLNTGFHDNTQTDRQQVFMTSWSPQVIYWPSHTLGNNWLNQNHVYKGPMGLGTWLPLNMLPQLWIVIIGTIELWS